MNISCDIIKHKSLWITVIPISEPFGHQSMPQVYILYNHSPKKEKQQKENCFSENKIKYNITHCKLYLPSLSYILILYMCLVLLIVVKCHSEN